jgi:hypothetical protein
LLSIESSGTMAIMAATGKSKTFARPIGCNTFAFKRA